MITITEKGAEKVHEFLSAQGADVSAAGLRVGVKGGGCSGFQYNLAFDEQRDGDEVFEHSGLKVYVDQPSLPYVRGSVIDAMRQDWVRTLRSRGISERSVLFKHVLRNAGVRPCPSWRCRSSASSAAR